MLGRSLALLVIAVLVAAGTAYYARNWLAQERQQVQEQTQHQVVEQAAPVAKMKSVLVAAETLSAGAFVRKESLRWQQWPEESLVEGYVVQTEGADQGTDPVEKMLGAVMRTMVQAGQPILPIMLVHPGDRSFLAAVLDPGMRAVSVPVDATTGIAGFVVPGDRVDVLLTARYRDKGEEGGDVTRYLSQTLLQDLKVLAIDQKTTTGDKGITVAKTATLAVTPKQAEKVAIGLSMGHLSLSLRSLAVDENLAKIDEKTGKQLVMAEDLEKSYTLDTDVYFMMGKKDAPAEIAPSQGRRAQSLLVIRGKKVDSQQF